MSLADLIRGKRKSVAGVATATPATFTTHGMANPLTVASEATVAVANAKTELGKVRQTLEQFAIDLGFQWSELLDAGVIAELDLDQFATDWNKSTPDQWRCYIHSIGLRARHGCPGLAHRITCNCGGKCRAFGEQP